MFEDLDYSISPSIKCGIFRQEELQLLCKYSTEYHSNTFYCRSPLHSASMVNHLASIFKVDIGTVKQYLKEKRNFVEFEIVRLGNEFCNQSFTKSQRGIAQQSGITQHHTALRERNSQ